MRDRQSLHSIFLQLNARNQVQDHLHKAITAFQEAERHAAEDVADEDSARPLASHPPPVQALFGRSAEVETVATMLATANSAYIALLGGPGMGKASEGGCRM